jgi:hypothetical protein
MGVIPGDDLQDLLCHDSVAHNDQVDLFCECVRKAGVPFCGVCDVCQGFLVQGVAWRTLNGLVGWWRESDRRSAGRESGRRCGALVPRRAVDIFMHQGEGLVHVVALAARQLGSGRACHKTEEPFTAFQTTVPLVLLVFVSFFEEKNTNDHAEDDNASAEDIGQEERVFGPD